LNPLFWRDRRVLLTGATGLLGSHLARKLTELGAEVVALSRDQNLFAAPKRSDANRPQGGREPSGASAQMQQMRASVVFGDCRDGALLRRVLSDYEVDTVFHLAAQTLVGPANLDPTTTFETNIAGTWRLLEACRFLPHVRQIVFASSDNAYGQQKQFPYAETAPLQGSQPYAVSKSCADLIAQTYAKTYGLPVSISRCGNFYGPGDLNWNRIVPGTIRSVLRGQRPLIRSDGRALRDYLYIQDALAAHLLLAQEMATRRELCGQAFNFGGGAPLSVVELVRAILKACRREDLQPEVRGEAQNEITNQSLDTHKARQTLGWKPRWSVEEGLKETVDWYRERLGFPPH